MLPFASIRELDAEIQGEWQLVQWSNRDMHPVTGRGRKVYRYPLDPTFYIIRDGHITAIQGTNVVMSSPYYITTVEDEVGGFTAHIIHTHTGRDCLAYLYEHNSVFMRDGMLCETAFHIDAGHGVQNSHVFEFKRVALQKRNYKAREQSPAGDVLKAAPEE